MFPGGVWSATRSAAAAAARGSAPSSRPERPLLGLLHPHCSHLITTALLSLQNMDRTVPGERKDHHSSCVYVCVCV